MESVLGRYRNLIILVGVLFLQVLGLATQVKRSGNDAEHTRLIRVWVVGAITPFERGLVWIENGTGNLWHNYFYLRGVRAENRDLKQQIEQMRLEQVRLSEDAAQARRLQTLLAFKEQFIARTVAAQVIGSSGSDLSRVVYIDKGEEDGLKRDMAVITADGIVGKILQVYRNPSVSQVLVINDQSSGVGALLEKTRLQGVLRGTAGGEVVLERVMSDEQVPIGETVLTSGGDQIFPKGLPVGTVMKVGSGKDLFLNIKVKPAADLSKLEEVLVLVEKQERQATAEEAVHLRASDILAQRLPSVPDNSAAVANSAAAAAGSSGASTTAMQPKSEVKQGGIVTKSQGLAASAKAATTAKTGGTGSPATATRKAARNPAGASGVPITLLPEQPIQPAGSPSAAPKTTDASSPTTGAEPDGSQSNPPSAETKPAKPSTPLQANPQPPGDENNPQ
jgi:rod shape-determining protein MreC